MAYSSFAPGLIPILPQSHGLIQLIKQSFLDHASASRIKQNSSIQRLPCGNKISLTTPNEILKLLKEIDTKKDCKLI